jgi:hypothetical protein
MNTKDLGVTFPKGRKENKLGCRYFHINSTNRSSGNNSSFSISIPPDCLGLDTKLSKMRMTVYLQEITFNRSWYDICDEFNNNKFEVFDGSVTEVIEIPDGNYTVNDLSKELNKLLAGIFNISYNYINNKYTFEASVLGNTLRPLNGFGQFIGCRDDTTYMNDFVSENPVNMSWESCIYLNSDISRNSDSFDNLRSSHLNNSTVIARIPILGAPYDDISYDNPSIQNSGINLILDQFDNMDFWLSTNKRTIVNQIYEWNFSLRLELYEIV